MPGIIQNGPRRLIHAIHSANKNESIVDSISSAPPTQVSIAVPSLSSRSEMARKEPIEITLKMQSLWGFRSAPGVVAPTRCGRPNAVSYTGGLQVEPAPVATRQPVNNSRDGLGYTVGEDHESDAR